MLASTLLCSQQMLLSHRHQPPAEHLRELRHRQRPLVMTASPLSLAMLDDFRSEVVERDAAAVRRRMLQPTAPAAAFVNHGGGGSCGGGRGGGGGDDRDLLTVRCDGGRTHRVHVLAADAASGPTRTAASRLAALGVGAPRRGASGGEVLPQAAAGQVRRRQAGGSLLCAKGEYSASQVTTPAHSTCTRTHMHALSHAPTHLQRMQRICTSTRASAHARTRTRDCVPCSLTPVEPPQVVSAFNAWKEELGRSYNNADGEALEPRHMLMHMHMHMSMHYTCMYMHTCMHMHTHLCT